LIGILTLNDRFHEERFPSFDHFWLLAKLAFVLQKQMVDNNILTTTQAQRRLGYGGRRYSVSPKLFVNFEHFFNFLMYTIAGVGDGAFLGPDARWQEFILFALQFANANMSAQIFY